MAGNKKPRKKYRPRARGDFDPIAYVLSGFSRLVDNNSEAVTLRIRNHAALEAIVKGEGTHDDVAIVLGAMDIALALVEQGLGGEYVDALVEAYHALRALAWRGVERGRFVCTGPEIVSINLAMEVHDAQLDAATVRDVETALAACQKLARAGRIQPLVESRDRRATKETA